MRYFAYLSKKDKDKKATSNLIGSSVAELSQSEIQGVSGGFWLGDAPKAQLSRQIFVMSCSGAMLAAIAPFPWVPLGVLVFSVSIPVFTSTLNAVKTATVVAEKINGAIVAAIGYALYNKYWLVNNEDNS